MGRSKRSRKQLSAERETAARAARPDLRVLLIYVALAAVTLAVYWQAAGFGFIKMDDEPYVTQNPHVTSGFTAQGIVWAFTGAGAGNWHPMTWLSLMLDREIGGVAPGTFHITSIILHVLNTLLLMALLNRLTGAFWRSAFVAGLFALHPLHVEPVAWISSRKDVLSTFFWFLGLLAYVQYARRPGRGRYALVAALFAFALMSKPMAVTFPLTLLLLDFWPLKRWRGWQSVIEKAPLFVMSAIGSALTIWAQRGVGAIQHFDELPFGARFLNAVVSYVVYIRQMIWPNRLGLFYPHPGPSLPMWHVGLSLLALAAITYLAIRARRRPYVLFGWLWYLITLVPVIGVLQVGGQAIADRYTYMPLLGLFVVVVWLIGDAVGDRKPAAVAGAAVLLVLALVAHRQASYWRDNETVWRHDIAVTRRNAIAYHNLSIVLGEQKRISEAIECAIKAVRINPHQIEACCNAGYWLTEQGKLDEAEAWLRRALKIDPNHTEANANMAAVMNRLQRYDEAFSYCARALRTGERQDEIRRIYGIALCNAGLARAQRGDVKGALGFFLRAIDIDPNSATARRYADMARQQLGNTRPGN